MKVCQGKGRERLIEEHTVSEARLEAALACYEEYPQEIDPAIEENSRPLSTVCSVTQIWT